MAHLAYGITLQLAVDGERVLLNAWVTDSVPVKRTYDCDSTLPARVEVEMSNLVRKCCMKLLADHT